MRNLTSGLFLALTLVLGSPVLAGASIIETSEESALRIGPGLEPNGFVFSPTSELSLKVGPILEPGGYLGGLT